MGSLDMEYGPDRTHRLTRDSGRGHPRKGAECFEARRNIVERVGVQCACTPVMPGVERAEELTDLLATTFAEHEPVWAHPQGLAQQTRQTKPACPLEVGLSRL